MWPIKDVFVIYCMLLRNGPNFSSDSHVEGLVSSMAEQNKNQSHDEKLHVNTRGVGKKNDSCMNPIEKYLRFKID